MLLVSIVANLAGRCWTERTKKSVVVGLEKIVGIWRGNGPTKWNNREGNNSQEDASLIVPMRNRVRSHTIAVFREVEATRVGSPTALELGGQQLAFIHAFEKAATRRKQTIDDEE